LIPKNDFELRLLSSLAKVFPGKAPPARHEKEWLSALRGETVSFQMAYRINGPFRSWAKLTTDAPGLQITMRRVRYIQGSIPSSYRTDDGYLTTAPGLFPDLLEPFDPGRLPLIPGSWQSIWIDIVAPPGAKAGGYPITVRVETPDGVTLGSAGTTLEVIAAELPAQSIAHTEWFHSDCLAAYYGVDVFSERYWEIVEHFVSYAVRHGINMLLTPIHTPPLDTEVGGERLTVQLIDVSAENGRYTFGFDKLARWVEMCGKAGVECLEIAHLFSQWGARYAPKVMGTRNGVYTRLFGWEDEATGPAYTGYLKQMLPELTAKLTEWGYADKTFFHISDEPDLAHFDQYAAARASVKPLLEGFKIIDALSDYEFYKRGAVPIPVPAVDHIEPFIEGGVPELWCYYCCGQSYMVPNRFFMLPSFRNRILGTLLFKYNIAGFLQWGYNFYSCVHSVYPINPFGVTDADGTFPSGDAFIVYPGPDGYPLGSLRLMVMNEALNDLRAFRLLESLAGRDFALAIIDGGLSKPVGFSCFPQNEEYLLSLRRRVNAEIAARISALT